MPPWPGPLHDRRGTTSGHTVLRSHLYVQASDSETPRQPAITTICKVHHREGNFADNIRPAKPWIEFNPIKHGNSIRSTQEHVSQMHIPMTFTKRTRRLLAMRRLPNDQRLRASSIETVSSSRAQLIRLVNQSEQRGRNYPELACTAAST